MEFIKRVEENIARTRETRWTTIRNMLDEYFKDVHDNWWTATRHDIQNYAEFKALFKTKYWSESAQNIVPVSYTHLDVYKRQAWVCEP